MYQSNQVLCIEFDSNCGPKRNYFEEDKLRRDNST